MISESTTTDNLSNITYEYNNTSDGCPPISEDPTSPYKLLNFIIIMVVSVVGLIGNLLVILTFHRQKKQTSATIFLKHLAVFDILLVVATNLFAQRYAYTIVFPAEWVNHLFSGKLTIATLPISYICQSLSTWTVVAVALDRYIHVCHPLKAMKWCRIRTAKRIICGIVIAAIVYNIPRFFEYYKILEVAHEAVDPCSGYFLVPEGTLGRNDIYLYIYAFGSYMVIMYVIPLGSLLFFNINLIRKLNAMLVPGAGGEVRKLQGSDRLLPSLIAVVTVFFVCQVPDMMLQILWRMNSPFAPTFSIIAYDCIIINSSINFVIYVVAAKGFRKSLIVHVLPCLTGADEADDLTTSNATTYPQKNKHLMSKSNNLHLSEYSKASNSVDNIWKQSHSNPHPVDTSDYDSDEKSEVDPLKILKSADVWIGGERRPMTSADYEEVEGAPAITVLPDGSNLGLTGVYIVTKDPLLKSASAEGRDDHANAKV